MTATVPSCSPSSVRVDFHTGVDEVTTYACGWLRKALRAGARVRVEGDPLALDLLDKALWTFDAQEFLPHLRLRAQDRVPEALWSTPVWLADPGTELPEGAAAPDLLLRIQPQHAWDATRPQRLVEIVGTDRDELREARTRWRTYQARGWQTAHHERRSAQEHSA